MKPIPPRPHRILLLEDDALLRGAFLAAASDRTDVVLEAVETAREVRERVERSPPIDLVVCDYRLRTGGGSETSADLVRDLHRARLAVALLTGYPKAAIESLGLRVPVYTKPVTLDELLEAVPRRR